MTQHSHVGSRNFIDSRVQNHNNELLGHVAEVVLDVGTGQVDHVVVACGGFLGFGRKLVEVPWGDLQTTYGDQLLIWEKSKKDIAALPRSSGGVTS